MIDKSRGVELTFQNGVYENQPKEGQGLISIEVVKSENLGKKIYSHLKKAVEKAKQEGKKLVFDVATGSSPEVLWPVLKQAIKEGEICLDDVIIIGHEEAWGTYEKGSHSDFDAARKDIFTSNGLSVKEIRSAEEIESGVKGNFVPMHLSDDSETAANNYSQILSALRKNKYPFFGLYGVGTDGHIAEQQIGSMGIGQTKNRKKTYPDRILSYTMDNSEAPQLFRWKKDERNFRHENNIFSEKGHLQAESGRAVAENYGGMKEIVGLGWRDMLSEDSITLVFNKSTKGLALELALKGSGSYKFNKGNEEGFLEIDYEKGKGEAILQEIEKYIGSLIDEGILAQEDLDRLKSESTSEQEKNLSGKFLLSGKYFSLIYEKLYLSEKSVKTSPEIYQKLWNLINLYLGKRAPVSRLIKMRRALGKETRLIVTEEAVEAAGYVSLK